MDRKSWPIGLVCGVETPESQNHGIQPFHPQHTCRSAGQVATTVPPNSSIVTVDHRVGWQCSVCVDYCMRIHSTDEGG